MTPVEGAETISGMEVGVFWLLSAVAVAGGMGLLFARKAVHAAVSMALVMVTLGIIYIVQSAEFVGIIQIFVYSGAVMMLFLFVVMMIGVDASDSMVETIRGHRGWAFAVGLVFLGFAVYGLSRVSWQAPVGLEQAQAEGSVTALAREIFERQVLPFEALGTLLVIAVMGAMVLAHGDRLVPKMTQRQAAQDKLRSGRWLAGKPNPGVYARHNAADTPALAPDGTPVEESVPRAIVARGQVSNPSAYRLPQTAATSAGEPAGDLDADDMPSGTVASQEVGHGPDQASGEPVDTQEDER
ncbi:NADH-quinone oxidoreductase subunit J [Ornithinimicrobium pratense]|uniref:NADH-quinone oxidoreductase subunit J n=1 Tax=Ornithinimicrobium pratense TaxID=2593973 RepID=A0A5J6V5Y4_9MICO|nr:NADH-quinone oxidoreductase subunit J [Ornithinimicrobium pratense]QFG69400.1 NADH-quinone oxidoreductase subunit J [Ornithinimicrobium pratense]